MVEAAGYGGLLAAVNWLYWIVAAIVLWVTWSNLPTQRSKIAGVTVVAVLFLALPSLRIYHFAIYKWQFNQAKAVFDERCKTAGERIFKTVENVDGVLLLNVRDANIAPNRANPLWPDAALPDEAGGDDYIRNFLYWEHDSGRASRGYLNPDPRQAKAPGYRFVDVKQHDGGVSRYRLAQIGNPDSTELVNEPVTGKPARYAVGFVNRVDPEDRKKWVAGTTITVTDTQTNEIMAQRESYAFEPGLGNTDGFRSPWGFAVTCPSWKGWDGARTRFFVDRILKPMRGE